MAKSKPVPSVDTSGYNWATGEFREPDMSKMPNLKPMASHEVGGLSRMTNTLPKVSRSVARPLSRKVSR